MLFRSVAVLAFPVSDDAGSTQTDKTKITTNIPDINPEDIFRHDLPNLIQIPFAEGKNFYINLEFERDFIARSISYEIRPQGKATTSATNIPSAPSETFVGTGYRILPDIGQLEVSDDGINYSFVCDLKPIYRAHENWRQKTISFSTVKGKYYRLNLHNWWDAEMRNKNLQLGRVVISSAAKSDQWEEKAGLFSEYIEPVINTQYKKQEVIDSKKIINLTEKTDDDGLLRWDVPKGKWQIMRFAYVPTGGSTKHGRKNLMGRECDKMSKKAEIGRAHV